jgi:hypothetical protein
MAVLTIATGSNGSFLAGRNRQKPANSGRWIDESQIGSFDPLRRIFSADELDIIPVAFLSGLCCIYCDSFQARQWLPGRQKTLSGITVAFERDSDVA